VELDELARYAAGLNAAFLTYVVGASFVTLQYSDLLWHMMTLSFILLRIARAELAEADRSVPELSPAWTSAMAGAVAARPETAPSRLAGRVPARRIS
jgi:hypothetical protein